MAKKISSDELMAGILSYIGFLVLVPLFVIKKRTTVANFHIQQGMNLFLLEVIAWVIGMVPVLGWAVAALTTIFCVVVSLIAILNAVQGKMWKIPVVHGLKLFDISNLK